MKMKCLLTSHSFHRCPSTTTSSINNSGRLWGVLQSRCYSPKQHFIRGFNLPPLTLKPNNQFPGKDTYVARVFKRGNADLTHDKELVNVRLNDFSKRLDDIGTKRLDDFAKYLKILESRISFNERVAFVLFGTIVGLVGLTIKLLGDQIDKLDKKIDKLSQDFDKKIDKLSHDLLKEIHALGNKKSGSW
jgi:hypothetical protein